MKTTLHLTSKELRARPWGAFGLILTLSLGAAAVAFVLSLRVSMNDQVRRLMVKTGGTIRIFSKDSDPRDYFMDARIKGSMPISLLQQLHQKLSREIQAVRHLTGHLYAPATIKGVEVVLDGTSSELDYLRRPIVIVIVKEGTAHLGSEVARRTELKVGDAFEIDGRSFRVAKIAEPLGTVEDYRAVVPLADVQAIADMPGRIHMIRATPCLCEEWGGDVVRGIRETFPETTVVQDIDVARTRLNTRKDVERFGMMAVIALAGLSGVLTAVFAALNARERRGETAILLAIGARRRTLLAIFLLKMAILGVLAGAAGYGLGLAAIAVLGPTVFKLPVLMIPLWWLPILSAATAALALIFAAVPVLAAVARDPAETLKREFL